MNLGDIDLHKFYCDIYTAVDRYGTYSSPGAVPRSDHRDGEGYAA